jgi:hypothetical protein
VPAGGTGRATHAAGLLLGDGKRIACTSHVSGNRQVAQGCPGLCWQVEQESPDCLRMATRLSFLQHGLALMNGSGMGRRALGPGGDRRGPTLRRRRRADALDIGPGEVLALVEQRLARYLAQGVGKAVTEAQACRVACGWRN